MAMPRAEIPARPDALLQGRAWMTSGIGPDLMQASRDAVRGMVDLLSKEQGLAAVDAYMLCSVAGDLRISQIVDAPNWTVTFHMPQSIFA